MEETIEIMQTCPECKGTGLIRHMTRTNIATLCQKCGGAGGIRVKIQQFVRREVPTNIHWVFLANPGITIENHDINKSFKDYGGIPFQEFNAGSPFQPNDPGPKMREKVCPSWWLESIPRAYRVPPFYTMHKPFKECEGCFMCKDPQGMHDCWNAYDKLIADTLKPQTDKSRRRVTQADVDKAKAQVAKRPDWASRTLAPIPRAPDLPIADIQHPKNISGDAVPSDFPKLNTTSIAAAGKKARGYRTGKH
jgi:hypothetical protein